VRVKNRARRCPHNRRQAWLTNRDNFGTDSLVEQQADAERKATGMVTAVCGWIGCHYPLTGVLKEDAKHATSAHGCTSVGNKERSVNISPNLAILWNDSPSRRHFRISTSETPGYHVLLISSGARGILGARADRYCVRAFTEVVGAVADSPLTCGASWQASNNSLGRGLVGMRGVVR
jgi:hypothetical protein